MGAMRLGLTVGFKLYFMTSATPLTQTNKYLGGIRQLMRGVHPVCTSEVAEGKKISILGN